MLDKQDIELLRQLNLESERRMMALMEAYFDPKFQAMNEKLDLIMERKASTDITDDLSDRVADVEVTVKNHSKEILRLKMAQ